MPLIHRGVVTRLGKMNKTVTVTVPYKKFMKKHKVEVIRHKRYLVHDNDHLAHLNDMVTIIHTVPKYSPRKAFRLHEIHRQGLDPNNYLEPDPAWKSIAAKRAAEDAQVHHRAATAARAQERSRKMAGSQSFMGDLAGVPKPKPKPKPRQITGDVGESSSAPGVLGSQDVDDAEAENIEESDEAYEDEVEGHEEEEVVQGEELDREIEEYERSEAGQRERREREGEASAVDPETLEPKRPTGEEPDRSDDDGKRR